MVGADTPVWSRSSSIGPATPDRNEAAGHDLVYGELLIGDVGGRRALLDEYSIIHRVAVVPHEEVAVFVRSHKLHGRGIGWIDAHLLASAIVADAPLWTGDERLAKAASDLGIAYER